MNDVTTYFTDILLEGHVSDTRDNNNSHTVAGQPGFIILIKKVHTYNAQ